jgi:hypothetical protein
MGARRGPAVDHKISRGEGAGRVKYDREIAKLQAEQASVGKTKNAEPRTR